MQKYSRVVLAISLLLTSSGLFAVDSTVDNINKAKPLPVLSPEDQHTTASKRITAQFTRAHYKAIQIDDVLSEQIFDRYIKQLDYARNVFLADDITSLSEHRHEFDSIIARGKLSVAYDIYNLNLERRLQRYEYALQLINSTPFDSEISASPFDFLKKEFYEFDREEASWAVNTEELDQLWRLKVKHDALNLTLTGKEWPKVKEILTKRYQYAIKRLKQSESEDVFQILMNSFARVVEPHTSYLSPRNAERFQMEMNLSLEGIGAVLRAEDDYTVIQSVVSGGPADKSKELKPKDRIVGVAQAEKGFVDIIGWRLDDVVELIKGPKGTQVRLQILSGDSEDAASVKVVSIIRDIIKLEDRAAKSEVYKETYSVEQASTEVANEGEPSKVVTDQNQLKDKSEGKKLGVITIPSFYNNLSRDVKKELEKLKAEHVEGIIVDLRGNGGGSLNEATLLTGLFINRGPVVQVRDGANRVQVNRDRDGLSYYDGPLTVMVDRYSASASEIFAAAIQDYGRGVIVGEHTFGKGTVQQHRGLGRVYDLYEKPLGSIQFTIAKFYRINGGSTQHRGVLPDISFPTAIDPNEWGESKEENALPWDQIERAKYLALNDLSAELPYLDSLHQQRIKNNREFNYLLDDISEYQQEKDEKVISLNIEERKAKRAERKAKQLVRVNERLVIMGKEKVTSLDDLPEALDKLDPFLDETAKITFDLIMLDKVAKK